MGVVSIALSMVVQEGHVMKMLKILTAVREDLRNFYVPAWLNKASQTKVQSKASKNRRLKMMPGDVWAGTLSVPFHGGFTNERGVRPGAENCAHAPSLGDRYLYTVRDSG